MQFLNCWFIFSMGNDGKKKRKLPVPFLKNVCGLFLKLMEKYCMGIENREKVTGRARGPFIN